jgi:hypothetical protein
LWFGSITKLTTSPIKSPIKKLSNRLSIALTAALSLQALVASPPLCAQAQSSSFTTWAVTIVLPPKVEAGRRATLAVLGVDGRLAGGVTVQLATGQLITTDTTGRASFTVPESGPGYIIAKGSGASVASLVDIARPVDVGQPATVAPFVSIREPFSICAAGLGAQPEANRVLIDSEPVLVMAASPECLVLLAPRKAVPGPVSISIEGLGVQYTASTTLVSLECQYPPAPWEPGKKGLLAVRARGSDMKLQIVVDNKTPGVLEIQRGDMQEVTTSGGADNSATLKVQAIRSGDFSLDARLLPAPDTATAIRYLHAAEPLASEDAQDDIRGLANKLEHHPRDFDSVRRRLDEIIANTIQGDLRTLLSAAASTL